MNIKDMKLAIDLEPYLNAMTVAVEAALEKGWRDGWEAGWRAGYDEGLYCEPPMSAVVDPRPTPPPAPPYPPLAGRQDDSPKP